MLAKMAHDSAGRSGGRKGGEELPDAELHLGMRIEHNPLVGRVAKSNGQHELEGSPTRFVEQTALQSRSHHIELGFTHGAFEAQEQPVIEGGRVIEPVFIQNQGPRQGTNFQEVVPIGGIAR